MMIQDLQACELVYLATPYTNYKDGPEIAFREACVLAGEFLRLGIATYSPIAHGHSIAAWGDMDPLDESVWMALADTMIAKADAMVIAKLDGWQDSRGIGHELAQAKLLKRPVYYMDRDSMELVDV